MKLLVMSNSWVVDCGAVGRLAMYAHTHGVRRVYIPIEIYRGEPDVDGP